MIKGAVILTVVVSSTLVIVGLMFEFAQTQPLLIHWRH